MSCDSCGSDRILSLNAKCSDRCTASFNGVHREGYAPSVANVSGGDYVTPSVCLECGKVQGSFPVEGPEGFEPLVCDECGEQPDPWKRQPEPGDRCKHQYETVQCGGYYYGAEG